MPWRWSLAYVPTSLLQRAVRPVQVLIVVLDAPAAAHPRMPGLLLGIPAAADDQVAGSPVVQKSLS